MVIDIAGYKITYISTERPEVHWYNTKYFSNVTLRSKRFNRRDPRHYVDLYVRTLITITNSLKMDFYFYQFLTNRYRPSFVELHYTFCDLIHFESLVGQPLRIALGDQDCPIIPGIYYLKNMSIPYVPKGFPFTKGRIYCNATFIEGGLSTLVGAASIDMEVKVAKIKSN